MSPAELEEAIAKLPSEELSRFAEWFQEYMADEWDRQIERDVAAGRLDKMIRKVDEDIDAGRATPL
jgi:hypothetical protein